MTAIEWIELAQERIIQAYVTDHRFNNVGYIGEALEYLNEAKALIHEHQTGLLVKNEEILTTNGQEL